MHAPLPAAARNVKVDMPVGFARLKNNSFYAAFTLDSGEMMSFISAPPGGYSPWKQLGEVYANKRFFTHYQHPSALQTSRIDGENKAYLIADPETGVVHALAWRD